LALASNSGNLVRTGYTFNGWNTQADGLGTDYAAGSNYTINAALTLYAKWTLDTYPVTYNGNSNTGGTAPNNQTKTYGVNLSLASNSGNLVRTGYTFNGWNTQADGLGTDYAAGSNYTTNAALTLYAKWSVAPPLPPPPPPPDFSQKQINENQIQLTSFNTAASIQIIPEGGAVTNNKTYEIALIIQNTSPVAAPAILASLNIPSELTVSSIKWEKQGQYYVDGNLTRTCSFDRRTSYCGVGQLWSGMKATITLRVSATPGQYTIGIKAEDLSASYEVTSNNYAAVVLALK